MTVKIPNKVFIFLMFQDIEMAKLDKSGVAYANIRKSMPRYLKEFQRLPDGLKKFIEEEMLRERPFYPDKGKGTLDRVMQRSIEIGCSIRNQKEEDPSRNIYDDIMPELADREHVSLDSIKQDYELRFMPIYEPSAQKAAVLMKEYLRIEKRNAKLEEILRTDKGKAWKAKRNAQKPTNTS